MTKDQIRDKVEKLFGRVPRLAINDQGDTDTEPYVIDVDLGLGLRRSYDGAVVGTGYTWEEAFNDLMANARRAMATYSGKVAELVEEMSAYGRIHNIVKGAVEANAKTAEKLAFVEAHMQGQRGHVTLPTPEEILNDNAPGSSTPVDPGLAGGVIAVPPATLTDEERRANEKAARVPIEPIPPPKD